MKATLRLFPYLLLAVVLAIVVCAGLAMMNRTKRLAENKYNPYQEIIRSDHVDGRKKFRTISGKKPAAKPAGEVAAAEQVDISTGEILGPPSPATLSQPVEATSQPAAVVAAPPSPAPAAPEPNTKPSPKPTPPFQPEPTPVASLPEPTLVPVAPTPGPSEPGPNSATPPPVIASNVVLTADQAWLLQDLYPGISEGWTIGEYIAVAVEFYARYEKWGGAADPVDIAFQEFLMAIDGEVHMASLSFPRSWLRSWRDDKFIQTTEIKRLDKHVYSFRNSSSL